MEDNLKLILVSYLMN